ncbi:probable F420-dependent oxidoreductase, Rv2161c family [Enhydrobacter aerosaccus]|uniref:Probable F420-dependent oxidoreductase, Rv2161c family n=1 Tax=Enhydrobacter aerosaccus TaxID=225324 RepID=A0A1T4T5K6_9HYPH|nr:LLM class F420-dependent oxidoreductase [Enhydrobacter aerosaccus]SKA35765.1 probable F420-dependent oxidoreductase, Rv2161c family [Enhydrobacter aerosaccus]
MQFGFSAPTAGPLSSADNLTRLATGAEALGYDYATFSDHVVIPTDIEARYPYSDTGEFSTAGNGERNEQLIEVAFVAARTSRLRLVTSVMVVPHRPAVLAAKQLATIDTLSGGRVTLGIGAGWMREEFEAIDAPDFDKRGKVTDEYVAAFRELWTQEHPRFSGTFVKFDNIVFAPKPAQKSGLPIWVGGESGPALRRTARLGDAWYPIGSNPTFPLDSLRRFRAGVEKLHKLAVEAGRDPKSIGLAFRFPKYGSALPDKAGDGERRLFSGSGAAIAADVKDLAAIGVTAIDLSFGGATVADMLEEMKRFRGEVMAKL